MDNHFSVCHLSYACLRQADIDLEVWSENSSYKKKATEKIFQVAFSCFTFY